MAILSPALAQLESRFVPDWSEASIGGARGLPRLAVGRWTRDVVRFQVPGVEAAVDCEQTAEQSWEFTLGTSQKLSFSERVPNAEIWMPEGPAFRPLFGGFKVDFLFDSKPPTNVFPMQLDLPNGWLMWFQPELTPLEVELGCVRPPWCVGSYALYCVDGWNPGAVNLRKLLHFPRPYAYSVGNPSKFVWGEWSWNPDTRVLAKVIPQWWFDSLRPGDYPIAVDDTFGAGLGGTGGGISSDYVSAGGPYSPASDGTADSAEWYADANETGTQWTGGLYPDSGGSPAGQTLIVDGDTNGTGGNNSWGSNTFDSNPNIYSANAYWIAKNNNKTYSSLYDATDGSVQWKYYASAYDDGVLPATFDASPSSQNWEVSIRCVYTPGGQEEEASLTVAQLSVQAPSVTPTYQSELSAPLSEASPAVQAPAVTATYQQEESAALAVGQLGVEAAAVTAQHVQEESAALAVAQLGLDAPAVTATYQSELSAGLSEAALSVQAPAVTPQYQAELSASLAEAVLTVEAPAVTASAGNEQTATLVVAQLGVDTPAVTATYVQEEQAALAVAQLAVDAPAVTATSGNEQTASLAEAALAVEAPGVTATHVQQESAALAIAQLTMQAPGVTGQYEAELTAALVAAQLAVELAAVTAQYQAELVGLQPAGQLAVELLSVAAIVVTVPIVLGPYRAPVGQVYVTGGRVGQIHVQGGQTGQVHVTGGQVGQVVR